jgi:mono/diheme cytochrome c family protein
MSRLTLVLLLLIPAQEVTREEAEKLFASDVHPVLKAKCFGCHGDDPQKLKGGLDLTTRDALFKGGDSGESPIVPGKPHASPLFAAIERKNDDLKMPPKDRDKLTPAEVEAFRRWISGGAPWVASKDPWAGSSPADRWAFYPVASVTPPAGAVHPVDAFLGARIREKGLRPAAEADPLTLIRRATLDLTGLPPTPAEIAANEPFENIVDRLLASPAYGEQWARHWLDVVRYADTSGFSNDFERPHAWRYRDYVVRSLNQDKPFDKFILEQIAGDELRGEDPEMLVAVGFLRMGPWEHTAMSVAALTRQHFLDDVTHATAATFLGLTMRCARCHDHKFDPLPTRDYHCRRATITVCRRCSRRRNSPSGPRRSSRRRTRAASRRRRRSARSG